MKPIADQLGTTEGKFVRRPGVERFGLTATPAQGTQHVRLVDPGNSIAAATG
ncbi:hypothetical protein [Kitasatospora sp. NPDC057198]|uniref:hypothetical protein n=1 Tax=Kitasatospora sp. NPDC057198 TaxID=3346046 RepID=UPI00363B933C